MYVFMYVGLYICIYVCVYVCMCVCMYFLIRFIEHASLQSSNTTELNFCCRGCSDQHDKCIPFIFAFALNQKFNNI